jgi:hypothetical protein
MQFLLDWDLGLVVFDALTGFIFAINLWNCLFGFNGQNTEKYWLATINIALSYWEAIFLYYIYNH